MYIWDYPSIHLGTCYLTCNTEGLNSKHFPPVRSNIGTVYGTEVLYIIVSSNTLNTTLGSVSAPQKCWIWVSPNTTEYSTGGGCSRKSFLQESKVELLVYSRHISKYCSNDCCGTYRERLTSDHTNSIMRFYDIHHRLSRCGLSLLSSRSTASGFNDIHVLPALVFEVSNIQPL